MKTSEEIKKGLECCDFEQWHNRECGECPYMNADDEWCESMDEIRNDALTYIRHLEAQVPRWISVEERLPEVDKRYGEYEYSADLLVHDGCRIRVAFYCHTTTVWYDSRYEDDNIDVTHWMQLPEPPKEDDHAAG